MSALKSRIIKSIQSEGPLSLSSYMAACLLDPVHGFYPTRDPLGEDGDFITAPEISQMFGEMLGLWCVQVWRDMGSPNPFSLVELGPGRGVMMQDILRASRIDPGFAAACDVYLLEASPALQAVQGRTLAGAPCPVKWADRIEDVPLQHTIILGNEFLDCLPIKQFIRKDGVWHERMVTIDPDDESKLIFGISPAPYPHADDIAHFPEQAKDGDLAEYCPGLAQIADQVHRLLGLYSGAALFIDYAPPSFEFGDTLQAIKAHIKVDPLDSPGDADLTARVDLEHLVRLARGRALKTYGIQTQAGLLARMGIELRAQALAKSKPEQSDILSRQLARLTDAEQMGQLFKAVCLQSTGLPVPPGFEGLHHD